MLKTEKSIKKVTYIMTNLLYVACSLSMLVWWAVYAYLSIMTDRGMPYLEALHMKHLAIAFCVGNVVLWGIIFIVYSCLESRWLSKISSTSKKADDKNHKLSTKNYMDL